MKEYDDGLFYGRPFQQLFQLHNQRISTQVLQLDSVTFCYKFSFLLDRCSPMDGTLTMMYFRVKMNLDSLFYSGVFVAGLEDLIEPLL